MGNLTERALAALDETIGTWDGYMNKHWDTIRLALKLAAKAAPDQEREEVARGCELWSNDVRQDSLRDTLREAARLLRTPVPELDSFNRDVRRQLEQEWAEVQLLKAANAPAPVVPDDEAVRLLREVMELIRKDCGGTDWEKWAIATDALLAAAPKPEDKV